MYEEELEEILDQALRDAFEHGDINPGKVQSFQHRGLSGHGVELTFDDGSKWQIEIKCARRPTGGQ